MPSLPTNVDTVGTFPAVPVPDVVPLVLEELDAPVVVVPAPEDVPAGGSHVRPGVQTSPAQQLD
jgi:hypothetical protein